MTYSRELKQLRSTLDSKRGERKRLKSQLKASRLRLKKKKRELRQLDKAKEVVRKAAIMTQEQIQYKISDLTSMAMEAVFDDPYQMNVEFVQRRNRTECDLKFSRGEKEINPLDASGGGAVDVAAFALRIASWSMQVPRPRPVMIMDEPFRFLDKTRQEKASQMLQELSEKLGIQFIIVTHEDALTEASDQVFEVKMKNGKSKVL